ncbi:lasso peptide biosynthesis B2 protein [Alkalicoccus luteus]|uniref:Lasso peptide biosynthesis B2 protein n=1 Tax=Alkalicoccus luteus TaxID=1237094 RepID=A0A969PTD4_9BACI|nr:lasso peptide biosynthesis B2 protein [Alkalicoccus luteus]NJP38026.1 lasso peptide biosynthesis B2 protein [Alkalicoccus luteus]
MLRKCSTLIFHSNGMRLLYAEAFAELAIAKVIKHRPFSQWQKKLGVPQAETLLSVYDAEERDKIRRVSGAVQTVAKYTFWESMCLVQALAASNMLKRRGYPSTFYLATARNEDGNLEAHAWLRSGTIFVTGGELRSQFTPAVTYALEGEQRRSSNVSSPKCIG